MIRSHAEFIQANGSSWENGPDSHPPRRRIRGIRHRNPPSVQSKPVVLITGASSGIGRACAEYLHSRGYCVYGTSRKAQEDVAAPGGFRMIEMDVTEEESVQRGVQLVLTREGVLDVVLNNAGDGVAGAVEDTSIEEARQQFETNFFGALRVCRAVLPAMRRRGSGLIVNVSSLGGLVALPFQGLYSASKFALEGMTEALRMEVRPHGVRVALLEPGDFHTGFTSAGRAARDAPRGVYRQRFLNALAAMERDESGGADPQLVARTLERIIVARAPRLRYKVGAWTQRFAAGWLRKVLPQRLFERLMMASYGVG
ncbi:MAG: SDR family oxidoreductase [Nevskia sp.]|nr:SDR family oxidoreductase [Nevskia sp.]